MASCHASALPGTPFPARRLRGAPNWTTQADWEDYEKEDTLFWRRGKQLQLHWITDDIAISRQPVGQEWASLREQGVSCVVDLQAEAPDNTRDVAEHELCYLRLPIVEGDVAEQTELEQVTAWIDEHAEQHGSVLVHCREGRGRSPMVVLAYLVRLGYPLPEAYRLMTRAHSRVAINAAQQEALVRFAEARSATEEDGA